MSSTRYKLVISPQLEAVLKSLKRRKPTLFKIFRKQVVKILREPLLGKPLRNILRNCRRVHVESYVLIYEIAQDEVRMLAFEHHDKVYK